MRRQFGHDAPTHHIVSEGGFEPPRPIGPLGPQPRPARCNALRGVSFRAVPCVDAADLVALVVPGGVGSATAWGNGWGNGQPRNSSRSRVTSACRTEVSSGSASCSSPEARSEILPVEEQDAVVRECSGMYLEA